MDRYVDIPDWQRAIFDRIEGGDEIVTHPRGGLVWRSMLEHVGYGQDVGEDGVETLAEATIDHEGVTHVRTVRLDDRNAEDG